MNDNARTLIAAPLPGRGFIYSKGYVHGVYVDGDAETDELLALLGLMNSFTCDWWVRRFADRHITKQIIDNLPLPVWNAEEIGEVAVAVAGILATNRLLELAGERRVVNATRGSSDRERRLVSIEDRVLRGFDLARDDLEVILEDFTDRGCPPSLRRALLDG